MLFHLCANAAARLRQADPGARLAQQRQRLDDLGQRLLGGLRGRLHDVNRRLSDAIAALAHCSPATRVQEQCALHERLAGRLTRALAARIGAAEHRLELAQRGLNSVSPLATLARGFAIVTRGADGALVTRADQVSAGDEIEARLDDGRIRARVIE